MVESLVRSLLDGDDVGQRLHLLGHLLQLEEHELHGLQGMDADDATLQLLVQVHDLLGGVKSVYYDRV